MAGHERSDLPEVVLGSVMSTKGIRIFLWIFMALSGLDARHATAADRASDTLTIHSLYREAQQYIDLGDNQADALINLAWQKSIEISYQQGVADGYYYSGRLLERRGKVVEAIEYYEKARSIYMLLGQVSKLTDTHVRLAGQYTQQDQLFLAHRSYREAIKAAAAHTDTLARVNASIRYAQFKNTVERDSEGALSLLDSVREEAAGLQHDPF